MKIKDIYQKAVKKAIKEDLRPKSVIEKDLKEAKKELKKLKGIKKEVFDKESLKNPYADSRILCGSPEKTVKNVLVGVDIDVAELLLADRLNEKGDEIGLVISHHPSGRAFAQLDKVLSLQPGIWETLGISKEIAEGIMKSRAEEVARGIAPRNHTRAVDAAKLLGIPFMCLHTTADNCVTNYLQKLFNSQKPKKLDNVLNLLLQIPEYKYAAKSGTGPHILIGKKNDKAGKIFVDMTGGTSGPDKVFSRLSQSGVKTIVGMHIRETGYKTVMSEFLNYIVAGHMASDNLGMNLLLDSIDPRDELNVIECSGFKRFRRK